MDSVAAQEGWWYTEHPCYSTPLTCLPRVCPHSEWCHRHTCQVFHLKQLPMDKTYQTQSIENGTRCRDGVNVLWCHSNLVWLVFESSIPTCACFHLEFFFCVNKYTYMALKNVCRPYDSTQAYKLQTLNFEPRPTREGFPNLLQFPP